jgi:predicted nicotinamide N-methyase
MSDANVPLHVFDLPQVWQKPTGDQLLQALEALAIDPPAFDTAHSRKNKRPHVDESGVPGYLTSIVASSLDWIQDEVIREEIWDAASIRLSERSGRTAMPAITRDFSVAPDLHIQLHEPSLTGDNLGLKTWGSSLLLSKELPKLRSHLATSRPIRLLELGAGTGLVGICAAIVWQADVVLTDLAEILPNLSSNIDLNRESIHSSHGSATARLLDWADAANSPTKEEEKFEVIIAADPVYSPDHPRMLVQAIMRWLSFGNDSRVIIGLPLRSHYANERDELRRLLRSAGLEISASGVEQGLDDWTDESGKQATFDCEWSVWAAKSWPVLRRGSVDG